MNSLLPFFFLWVVAFGVLMMMGLFLLVVYYHVLRFRILRCVERKYYKVYRAIQGLSNLTPDPFSIVRNVDWGQRRMWQFLTELGTRDPWVAQNAVRLRHLDRLFLGLLAVQLSLILFSVGIGLLWAMMRT